MSLSGQRNAIGRMVAQKYPSEK